MKTKKRSSRLYRWFLRLFPAEFRGDFGDEMTQVFDEERLDASLQGTMAVARLWSRTIGGVAAVASREHLATLRRDAGYALRLMWNERLTTAAIIATLAVGVGTTSAMFAVVKAVSTPASSPASRVPPLKRSWMGSAARRNPQRNRSVRVCCP